MASFREQVDSLVGKRIRLGRGGPDERKGTLVSVQDEYLSVYSDDGSMVHYPLHHLKSVTELMDGGGEGSGDGSGSRAGSGWDFTGAGEGAGFAPTFRGLMDSFLGQKVQVYDHGPESAAGFVFEVGDDFVKLVTGPDEMVHFHFFHIRSVRLAKPKGENKGGGKSGNKGGGGGKSGGGKSGGGKSGGGKSSGGKSGGGKSGGGKSGGGKSGGGKSGGGKSGSGSRGGKSGSGSRGGKSGGGSRGGKSGGGSRGKSGGGRGGRRKSGHS